MPWSSRLNAEIYDRFVREHGVYGWLNEHLVRDADVVDGHSILDLGCGTGATTLACLPHMPAQGEILGVDASAGMVGVAQANVHDPRARFVVAPAAEVGRLPPPDDGPYDRVISNAAFLQFHHRDRVLAGLAPRVVEGGLLVFNVSAERLAGEPVRAHPFQVALQSEVRRLQPEEHVQDQIVDSIDLCDELADAGFQLITPPLRRTYRTSQLELVELMAIPAMIGRVAVGLGEGERQDVVERVRHRVDLSAEVEVDWVTFRFRRL